MSVRVLEEELQIGTDPAEVGRARRWTRARLTAAGVGGDEPVAETLVLLVSELVTNAVVHTGRPAVLRLLLPVDRRRPGSVRAEVADAGGLPPRQRHAGSDDSGGRGLELVAGLASRWGWRWQGPGKSIWCELDRAAEPVEADAEWSCPVCRERYGRGPGAGSGTGCGRGTAPGSGQGRTEWQEGAEEIAVEPLCAPAHSDPLGAPPGVPSGAGSAARVENPECVEGPERVGRAGRAGRFVPAGWRPGPTTSGPMQTFGT